MYDLIIVGAGPVGSHLGKEMAEKGLDVMIIERSDEIGKPLACSGHVSPDIWDFVPEEAREKLEQNRINGANFHVGSSEYSFYRDETVSYVIDRVELDKVKAREAENAGVEIHTGEEVTGVKENSSHVEVDTDSSSYRAKMVAGCDGASSKVRSEVGLPEPDHFYQGILCFTDEDDGSDFVDVFTQVPSFFGWRIPRGDSVEYGAAVPRGEEPMKWLEEITGNYVEDSDRHSFCAGAIPIGPAETVTKKRVFLVGDAAAQTKPFTGGGILYGMRCASTAAQSINVDEPDSLELYETRWRKDLETEIFLGSWIERSYSWPESIQKLGMKFFEGEIGVHMDQPSSLFSFEQLKRMLRPGSRQ